MLGRGEKDFTRSIKEVGGMNVMLKRAIVLAPHTDDGELGCGATISKLLRKNVEVFYAAFSTCEDSVPDGLPKGILRDELFKATSELGIENKNVIVLNYRVRHFNEERQEILDELIRLKREINPQLVFMPSQNDIHQDHLTIAKEGLRAFKTNTILAYEAPWNNYSFSNQAFVEVNKEDMQRKLAALAKYESQNGRPYIAPEYTVGQLRLHGVQIGREYAEVFEVPRMIFS